jgi:UDP-N-acetylglucosamine diphosphorylase/glucosamine-1-phosphate N-acetyltransferase
MMPPIPPVVLFEDDAVPGLGPVVALRPTWEIRVGIFNLRERLGLCAGVGSVTGECRDLVRPGALLRPPTGDGPVLRINARLCASVEDLEASISALAEGEAFVADGVPVMSHGEVRSERAAPDGLAVVDRPWKYLGLNDVLLEHDAGTIQSRGGIPRNIHAVEFVGASERRALLDASAFAPLETAEGATLIGPGPILAGAGAVVRPSAVIDAAAGPVVLGAGVVIHPLSVVTGPAYLGPGTVVNPGAKIRHGTSAGAFCKLGGEVEESLILDLSNKQHDGFLGHAIVGSWVNLGADTNGSDLKNNYSSVRVDLGEGQIESGQSFVGPHVGDHAKTGIDTMLTTGGVLGVAANVFGGGFVPRFVPAFAWGGAEGLSVYRLEAALETARAVYGRRDVAWTGAVEDTLRRHFTATAEQRERYGVR